MVPTPQPPRRHRHDAPCSVAVQPTPLSHGHGRDKRASATSGTCTGCDAEGCFARVLAARLLDRAAHRARRSRGDGAPARLPEQACGGDWPGGSAEPRCAVARGRYVRLRLHGVHPFSASRGWPPKFRPALPKGYDGSSNPIEFLQLYTTSIQAAGGDDKVMANWFSHALRDSALS